MQYDFNLRQKCIIHYLSSRSDYCSGDELASVAHVSARTIRKEIKDINLLLDKLDHNDSFIIESVHSKGYRFKVMDRTAFESFIHDLDYDVTALEQRLWNFIEKQIRLLTVMVDRLDITMLEDIIHYSESAIRSVIRDMDSEHDYTEKLTITMNGSRLYPQGSEYFIRIGALKVIFADLTFKGATADALAYLKNETFEEYARSCMISEFMHDSQYSIGELGIEFAVQFLWISHVRNVMGYFLEFQEEELRLIAQYDRCFILASRIMKTLTQKADFCFTESDTYVLALIFACVCDFRDAQMMPLDSKSNELCQHTAQFLMKDMNLDSEYKDSVIDALHPFFYSFYLRSHFKIARQYIGVTRIKRKAISAVEYSRHLGREIERYSGIAVSDKEIVYLSRCITLIQNLFNKRSGKRVLVSSKYGLDEGKRFADSLQRVYGGYISEIKVMETYEAEAYGYEFDLVFTDDGKKENASRDFGNIRVYSEYSRARALPANIVYDIRQLKDASYFMRLIQQDAFVSFDAKSREEVYVYVEQLARQMYGIEDPLHEMLAEEDNRLTYECGHRAVLIHVRRAEIQRDQIRVGTLQKPIVWKNKLIQLILMIFTGEDYHALWQYEHGLRSLMRTPSNTSLLVDRPSVETLQKIFEEGTE